MGGGEHLNWNQIGPGQVASSVKNAKSATRSFEDFVKTAKRDTHTSEVQAYNLIKSAHDRHLWESYKRVNVAAADASAADGFSPNIADTEVTQIGKMIATPPPSPPFGLDAGVV